MKKISKQKQLELDLDKQLRAEFKQTGQINPMSFSQEQYFLGGFLGQGLNPGKGSGVTGMAAGIGSTLIPGQNKQGNTSIGGSAAKGALSGAASGAMFGPIGMGIGALVGGVAGFFGGRKQQREELAQQAELEQLQKDESTKTALSQMNFVNNSNLPMSYGGQLSNPMQVPIGSFNDFPTGGTHESNPNGGIPQGHNSNGQLRTVEQGEGAFQFKEGKYIFSNRLKFE